MKSQPFGKMPDGTAIDLYTLASDFLEVDVIPYGGIVVALRTKDRNGKMSDVVLGFGTLAEYVANNNSPGPVFFGAAVGRYANRIAKAQFAIDGKQFSVPRNDGQNSLHGGPKGFFNVVWKAKPVPDGIELTYLSRDGEEGYPGNLTTTMRYLARGSDFRIEYEATTDQPTVVNLTHHSYFNLAGHDHGSILDHELSLKASRYTPVDASLIPTGELASVAGTPFDFRQATRVGARIDAQHEQMQRGNGYDHNWALDSQDRTLALAAEVQESTTGRTMQVLTTEPGIQFYSGNFLKGSFRGKHGASYGTRSGFCLETQHYPDSPNHPQFPTTVLRPGQRLASVTVYRFGAR